VKPSPDPSAQAETAYGGIGTPLRDPIFRRIWSTSLLSNLGQQMQAVAAAWVMLEITRAADLVALVQSASMLPVMLFALPSGALADMYDRRKVAVAALFLSLLGASLLAFASLASVISPIVILAGVFVTGTGISLYAPAWQASVAELVGPRALPAAISLYAMSSNAARSLGPAIGGFVVASAGALAAFSVNAVLYLPLLAALLLWRREVPPPRLPPERLDRAIGAGLRYVRHSQQLRRAIFRSMLAGVGGAAIYALLPLVADEMLGGGAKTYGLLLGGFGLGAVGLAAIASTIQARFAPERVACLSSLALAAAIMIIATSTSLGLTITAMVFAGGSWMILIATYNVSIQLASPRWVSGRTLAAFQVGIAGGLAGGAALWGFIAEELGVEATLIITSGFVAFTATIGLVASLTRPVAPEQAPPPARDPIVQMALTGTSGPVVIEIAYQVRNENAREFYHAMRAVIRSRERNGAFATSLRRDISNPLLWVEQFTYTTWDDYLRARNRPTSADRSLRDQAYAFHMRDELPVIRLYLERPTGSVRWSDDAIDPGQALPGPVGPVPFSPN